MSARKLAIVISCLFTVLLALSPIVMGTLIQGRYLQTIPKLANKDMKITVDDYQLGYLSSKSNITVEIANSDRSQPPHLLTLSQKIHHGPVIFRYAQGNFTVDVLPTIIDSHLTGAWAEKVTNFFANNDPLKITSIINWYNFGKTEIKLADLDRTQPNFPVKLKWQNVRLDFEHDLLWNEIASVLKSSSFDFENNIHVNLQGLQYHWRGNSHKNLLTDNAGLAIKQLTIDYPEQKIISLEQLRLNLDIPNTSKDIFNIFLTGQTVHGTIYDQTFNDEHGILQITNLSPATLERLSNIKLDEEVTQVTQSMLDELNQSESRFYLQLPKTLMQYLTTMVNFETYRSFLALQSKKPLPQLLTIFKEHTLALYEELIANKTLLEIDNYYQFELMFTRNGQVSLNDEKITEPLSLITAETEKTKKPD